MFGKKDRPSTISREDHGALNNPNKTQAVIDQLRAKYSGSPEAQREIDIYAASPGGGSEYFDLFDQYRNALRNGDQKEADRLYALFKKNY